MKAQDQDHINDTKRMLSVISSMNEQSHYKQEKTKKRPKKAKLKRRIFNIREDKGIMPTKVELTPEQSQHGDSDDVLNIRVILFSIHSDDGHPSSVNIKQHCG
ncbi:hypothetical protein Tco_0373415, partial [Tanacetum coccineum]